MDRKAFTVEEIELVKKALMSLDRKNTEGKEDLINRVVDFLTSRYSK